MDLKQIKVSAYDGEWLPVTMPDGSATGIEFYMVGKDSDECRVATRLASLKIRKRKGDFNPEEAEADNMNAVIACIKDWRDRERQADYSVQIGEEFLKCTYENKKRVLKEFPFMYRQADGYIVDDSNFFKV